jgi:copper(I)-binding protein
MLVIACSPPPGPPLTISELVIPEPPPGTSVTAAYLTLSNDSDQPIAIEKVTSPQFARVSIHETLSLDDVSRMV